MLFRSVGVEGFAFRTNTGELSVHCQKLTLLSKSLRPLPVVKEKDGQTFDAFTDPEIRYRQRYVDLIVNPHVREVFIKRSKIISTMREYFNQFGYVEVEVLDEHQIEELGMGAFLSVAKGSTVPPRFIAIRYRGTNAALPPVAFVGKGITFEIGRASCRERV